MKKKLLVTLLTSVLAISLLTGCNLNSKKNTETTNANKEKLEHSAQEEKADNEVQDKTSDKVKTETSKTNSDATKTDTSSESATASDNKTSDKTSNTTSSNSNTNKTETNKNSSTTTTSSTKTEDKSSAQAANKEGTHTHKWVEHTKTNQHKEEGHYETQVVQSVYDEDVYAWRTFCNKCNKDLTELSDVELSVHSAVLCESGYHAAYVVVDTIHHDAVTKQVWVVDKYGYTETITIYKCECGATK